MKIKKYRIIFSVLSVLTLLSTFACSSPTPMIIEITREVPITQIATQIVTQIVTAIPTPTPITTPTPKPVVQKPPAYVPLENCPASYLRPGFHVMVSTIGGSNAIRPSPDLTGATITGYALPGEVLLIIGGPVCNYGWLVWQVETQYGLQGWTPETNGKDYWLIPVMPVPINIP
jgi:hypothetical protein